MANPNTSVFDAINDLAGRSAVFDDVNKFLAKDMIYVVVALGVALLAWLLLRNVRNAFEVAVIMAAAVLLSLVIGRIVAHFWFEARPWVDHAGTVKLISHSADASFPSDHCLVAGAIGVVALLAWRWLGIVVLVLALLIAWSRVFVGVHYPGDVLAGLAIGAVCGLVCWFVVKRLSPHIPILGGIGVAGR
jgi:membrane-associated phospholipid phosphatase